MPELRTGAEPCRRRGASFSRKCVRNRSGAKGLEEIDTESGKSTSKQQIGIDPQDRHRFRKIDTENKKIVSIHKIGIDLAKIPRKQEIDIDR